jgi:hypothetical protein
VVVSYIPPTPGITRMEATLRQNLTWPNLKMDVEAAVKMSDRQEGEKEIW